MAELYNNALIWVAENRYQAAWWAILALLSPIVHKPLKEACHRFKIERIRWINRRRRQRANRPHMRWFLMCGIEGPDEQTRAKLKDMPLWLAGYAFAYSEAVYRRADVNDERERTALTLDLIEYLLGCDRQTALAVRDLHVEGMTTSHPTYLKGKWAGWERGGKARMELPPGYVL